jgi:hypothetical protein
MLLELKSAHKQIFIYIFFYFLHCSSYIRQTSPLFMKDNDRPIPVPSGCIDLFPADMRGIYWKMFPSGQEMPATVPPKIWNKHMLKCLGENAKIPPPPPLWVNYWEKIDWPKGPLPPVPVEFWDAYLNMFPNGHFPMSKDDSK